MLLNRWLQCNPSLLVVVVPRPGPRPGPGPGLRLAAEARASELGLWLLARVIGQRLRQTPKLGLPGPGVSGLD